MTGPSVLFAVVLKRPWLSWLMNRKIHILRQTQAFSIFYSLINNQFLSEI